MMEAILGPLPPRFIRETRKTKYFWHSQLDWDPESPDGKYVREHCKKLKVIKLLVSLDVHVCNSQEIYQYINNSMCFDNMSIVQYSCTL